VEFGRRLAFVDLTFMTRISDFQDEILKRNVTDGEGLERDARRGRANNSRVEAVIPTSITDRPYTVTDDEILHCGGGLVGLEGRRSRLARNSS
jgi:hypothetical protein